MATKEAKRIPQGQWNPFNSLCSFGSQRNPLGKQQGYRE